MAKVIDPDTLKGPEQMPDVDVTDPASGSVDKETRFQWRRNRRAAYRLSYKEVKGKKHPASKGDLAKMEKALADEVKVPFGMTWADFGVLWDLHPDHPFISVLRRRSVEDEWNEQVSGFAEPLPVADKAEPEVEASDEDE